MATTANYNLALGINLQCIFQWKWPKLVKVGVLRPVQQFSGNGRETQKVMDNFLQKTNGAGCLKNTDPQ